MLQGWVSINRSITDSFYYKDSHYIHLWVHLILRANHQDAFILLDGKKFPIKRGQFLTSRTKLAAETGINESKVERILKCFESEQQIEQQKKTKYRLITITNYDKYQGSEQQNEQQMNSKRTANEQQMNTNNNQNQNNKENKEKKSKEKKEVKKGDFLFSGKKDLGSGFNILEHIKLETDMYATETARILNLDYMFLIGKYNDFVKNDPPKNPDKAFMAWMSSYTKPIIKGRGLGR